jgi:hypothetical protein
LVDENLGAGMISYVLEEESGATGSVVPWSRRRSETRGTLFRGEGWGVKIPTLPQRTREGRGTLFFFLHVHLADAVGDFGDFEDGVDLGLNAFEFTGAVEGGDPLAKVIEGQRESPGNE